VSSFAAYEVVQLTVALEHEPAGAEHRVAEYKPNPGQDRKRGSQLITTGRSTLHEGDDRRAQEGTPVPRVAHGSLR